MEELLQRITAIEQRLLELEAQAHSGHTLSPEAIIEVATHAVERINEGMRALFHKSSESDSQVTESVSTVEKKS